jgi:sRNA-binding carbon storage regulator CsrA
METFDRAKSEAVVVNGEVVVRVIDILDEEVVLAIHAPDWVEVFPTEASNGAETMERAGKSERRPLGFEFGADLVDGGSRCPDST